MSTRHAVDNMQLAQLRILQMRWRTAGIFGSACAIRVSPTPALGLKPVLMVSRTTLLPTAQSNRMISPRPVFSGRDLVRRVTFLESEMASDPREAIANFFIISSGGNT